MCWYSPMSSSSLTPDNDAAQRFWQALSKNWPDGVITYHPDGSIITVSPAASRNLGWQAQEVQGSNIHDLVCSQSRKYYHEIDDCPLMHCQTPEERHEGVWKMKDGAHTTVQYRVTALNTPDIFFSRLVIFQDTSKLKFQSYDKKKLLLFADIAPTPMLELDKKGTILFGNPTMIELMANHDFTEKGHTCVLPPNIDKLVGQCLDTKKTINNIETAVGNKTFLWSIHPFNDELTSVLISGIDISEKKHLERQAKEIDKKIEQEKETSRRQYVASMIHELRSPLNAIMGFAQLLNSKDIAVDEEQRKEYVSYITEGCNKLAEQISTSLNMSRVESAQLAPTFREFNLNQLSTELINEFTPLAHQNHLTLETHLPDPPVTPIADQQLIRQLLVNLIGNAIKYTEKGSVTLAIATPEERHDIVRLEVSDTGCGISDEGKSIIFDVFSRLEQHRESDIEGTGIGLSLAKEIVDIHSGTIDVESVIDRGSTFIVELPLDCDKAGKSGVI